MVKVPLAVDPPTRQSSSRWESTRYPVKSRLRSCTTCPPVVIGNGHDSAHFIYLPEGRGDNELFACLLLQCLPREIWVMLSRLDPQELEGPGWGGRFPQDSPWPAFVVSRPGHCCSSLDGSRLGRRPGGRSAAAITEERLDEPGGGKPGNMKGGKGHKNKSGSKATMSAVATFRVASGLYEALLSLRQGLSIWEPCNVWLAVKINGGAYRHRRRAVGPYAGPENGRRFLVDNDASYSICPYATAPPSLPPPFWPSVQDWLFHVVCGGCCWFSRTASTVGVSSSCHSSSTSPCGRRGDWEIGLCREGWAGLSGNYYFLSYAYSFLNFLSL